MNLKEFAQRMDINYTTAVRWLKLRLIKGAKLRTVGRVKVWEIPESALNMERPKRGYKPGSRKGKDKA